MFKFNKEALYIDNNKYYHLTYRLIPMSIRHPTYNPFVFGHMALIPELLE